MKKMSIEETESEPVLYNVKLGIAYITLNTKMNTINMDTARKLVQLLNESDKNPKVKVIVIKSMGDKVFSAGFDLAMFKQGFNDKIMSDLLSYGRDISRAIYFLKKPVISQIQGSAIGMGCIMALSSDFRFVAKKEGLFFRLPEIDINIFPATGPTAMAVNILGVSHAKDMLYTGRKVPLEEFDHWGAITKVCEPENLADEVKKFARELAQKNQTLMKMIKPAVNIMTFEKAKDWFDLENEMAENYFAGLLSKEEFDLDKFIHEMWEKYGKGSPKFD